MTRDRGNTNFYCAIDLGTTNTAIAYGAVNHKKNRFEANIIKLRVPQGNGELMEQEVVPSCVYIDQKLKPTVGNYAKNMASQLPSQVVTSVKSSMGTGKSYNILDKQYSPAKISSMIIKFALVNAQRFFRVMPDDVIITVPASFDSEMRSDTIKAASLAGIKVKNDDGSMRKILLDEPRAALYNFIDGLDKGEYPEEILDLREPKNVLVYDLGGGTLDVSLHRVWRDEEYAVRFEDYAISRHTLVGGDNFDEMFAQYLYATQLAPKIKEANNYEKQVGLQRLRILAEKAKKSITEQYEQYKLICENGEEPDISVEVIHSSIIEGIPINAKISERQYEQIVEPLLGKEYTLEDVQQVKKGKILETNNIIYPILDVLDKAYQREGRDIKVDAVLLNGGMTKLPLIQRRLKKFFGIEPLEVQNPDLSVALGAVYYHHALHKGLKIPSILNDSIGIELAGEKVRHLARAGVTLPFKSKVYDEFRVKRDGTTCISIPFYLGGREDIYWPNKEIASRQIHFEQGIQRKDKVCIQLEVSEEGIITTKIWLNDAIDQKQTMKIEYLKEEAEKLDVQEETSEQEAKINEENAKGIKNKRDKSAEWVDTAENVIGEEIIDNLIEQCKEYSKSGQGRMDQIRREEKLIVGGSNKKELIKLLMARINNEADIFTVSRLILATGELMKVVGLNEDFLSYTKNQIIHLKESFSIQEKINFYRYQIEAIGKAGDVRGEAILTELLDIKKPDMTKLSEPIIRSLGKVAVTRKSFDKLIGYLTKSQNNANIYTLWAIGRVGSRENPEPINISEVEYSVPIIIEVVECNNNPAVTRRGIYALAEIGDRRKRRNCISNENAGKILSLIKKFREKQIKCPGVNMMSILDIGEKMVNGQVLSASQQSNLLDIRSEEEWRIDEE